jgi:hypothetical protein
VEYLTVVIVDRSVWAIILKEALVKLQGAYAKGGGGGGGDVEEDTKQKKKIVFVIEAEFLFSSN